MKDVMFSEISSIPRDDGVVIPENTISEALSFLDDHEIPETAGKEALEILKEQGYKILFRNCKLSELKFGPYSTCKNVKVVTPDGEELPNFSKEYVCLFDSYLGRLNVFSSKTCVIDPLNEASYRIAFLYNKSGVLKKTTIDYYFGDNYLVKIDLFDDGKLITYVHRHNIFFTQAMKLEQTIPIINISTVNIKPNKYLDIDVRDKYSELLKYRGYMGWSDTLNYHALDRAAKSVNKDLIFQTYSAAAEFNLTGE